MCPPFVLPRRYSLKPSVYRSVIDDVIKNIKSEFDEYGVAEDVLADLQSVSVAWDLSS